MQRFLVRRLVFSVFSLLGITLIIFGLSRMGPDPLLVFVHEGYHRTPESEAALRARWGLDRPLYIQYLTWLGNALRGDFGNSIARQVPVTRVIGERIFPTVQLGLAAWLIATLVGIPLGVLSALRRGGGWDYFARFIALIGQATPAFWLAILVLWVFAVQLGLFPAGGRPEIGAPAGTHLKAMILPALVLGFNPWAIYLRITRSAMLEIMDSEYIKFARSKGVNWQVVVWKHAMRNALIQPITVSTVAMASFITGAVFVETVYSWPGLGRLAVQAALDNDFPVVSAVVLLFGVVYIGMNLVADIAYAYVDPRIRYT